MNKIRNMARAAQVAVLSGAFLAVTSVTASATEPSPDPVVTQAIEDGFAEMSTLFLTVIAPAIFGLVLAIIGVTFGIRKMRQNTK